MIYNKENIKTELSLNIKNIVEAALHDPQLLQEVIDNSVEHDNGFLKIVLQERSENFNGYRIHFWKPGAFDSNIHSHRWNMASFILDGGYSASEFIESKEGNPYHSYTFEPINNNNYKLFSMGLSHLNTLSTKNFKKNDSYEMLKGEIHKICKVGDKGAVSAMITWGDADKTAKVFSSSRINEFTSSQRPLLRGEVIERLHKTLDLLNELN